MKQMVLPPGARQGNLVRLQGDDFHYLVHVRRLTLGTTIHALDQHEKLTLSVTDIGTQSITLSIVASDSTSRPTSSLTLFPFLLKGRKLDDVIRQACEAGVEVVIPVEGDHSVARLTDGSSKVDRWRSIAREAAQQSGQPHVTEVRTPIRSADLTASWSEADPLLFFHQSPLDTGSLHGYLFSRPSRIGLVIGPEGGLSEAEVSQLRSRGALPVWLGPFVLRAETASLYAVAAVNAILQESSVWTMR